MGYCDFNPRLFKPFTSKKTKIIPGMADDWEMIPDQYVKIGGFSLRSVKLNQEVADISLTRFLKFCKEQNLTIEGLKLKGSFVVGNDRSVYTVDMFNTWKEKFDIRTEVIIDKKDLIPGHLYKTPCGAEIVYLGAWHYSSNKTKEVRVDGKGYSCNWETIIESTGKVSRKHLMLDNYNELRNSYYGGFKILNQKATKDLGEKYTVEEIEEHIRKCANRNFLSYDYFGKTKDGKNLCTSSTK